MTQQPDTDAPPAPPALKIPEPKVDAKKPWGDDKLDRKEIADRLTTIVRGQEAPFVISVDGRWGTGKTFLLKRWQQDLENEGWQAIYYNAWEDDFAGDPLISVTGQLSEHLKKGSLWAKARKLGRLVAPFVQPVASTASIATTGVPVPNIRRSKQAPPNDLADYLEKRAAKDGLKKHLAELAAEVRADTDQPLLFIIDELDRCRPTFAIELLERVKHIFDVPNIVFVFGINRSELVKSLELVYGEIDAGTYLRRFFDMEFVLPEADPGAFCSYLASRFGLEEFFAKLRPNPNYYLPAGGEALVPVVFGRMGLSLRDMDYCLRLLAVAARDEETGKRIFPDLFILLVATKIANPDLYRRFAEGDATAVDLIDNLNQARIALPPVDPDKARVESSLLIWVEAAAYNAADPEAAREELLHVQSRAGELRGPLHISAEASLLDPRIDDEGERLADLIRLLPPNSGSRPFIGYGSAPGSLSPRIDLYAGLVER